ncbi:hypothetical protein OsJ_30125 [Oryza sativa Japonica Group]|uniref:HVA22-like protein n=1 Tax=Oryza sativa subsp. japonica TaxID=39947 RepID=A3C0Y3_ORYSJ|nr:hypothetical protein OsJ_30125 [Oryza sativa Japonica Group]
MAVLLITRLLTLVLGYAYPAYDCYKTLELNKPQIDQLRFWCQYWILLAFLTTLETITYFTVSWLPMYGEAKLALVLYLWYPKTRGAKHVYESYLQPVLARHEADIDRGLLQLRASAKDATASHLQAAVSLGPGLLRRSRRPRLVAAAGGEKQRRRRPRRPENRFAFSVTVDHQLVTIDAMIDTPGLHADQLQKRQKINPEEEEEDEDATVSKTRR